MIAEAPTRLTVSALPPGSAGGSAPDARACCSRCHTRPVHTRKSGLCRACYLEQWVASKPMCLAEGCQHHAYAKGLCRGHYWQKSCGRALTSLRVGNVQQMDDGALVEFQREHVMYELRLERDAYRCAVGVAARLAHRREIIRLEALVKAFIQTGGA
jgi:hypothetical protein